MLQHKIFFQYPLSIIRWCSVDTERKFCFVASFKNLINEAFNTNRFYQNSLPVLTYSNITFQYLYLGYVFIILLLLLYYYYYVVYVRIIVILWHYLHMSIIYYYVHIWQFFAFIHSRADNYCIYRTFGMLSSVSHCCFYLLY